MKKNIISENIMKKGEFSDEKLDALIEEATVDCYGDYECLTGFCCTFENEFKFPFKAKAFSPNNLQ